MQFSLFRLVEKSNISSLSSETLCLYQVMFPLSTFPEQRISDRLPEDIPKDDIDSRGMEFLRPKCVQEVWLLIYKAAGAF